MGLGRTASSCRSVAPWFLLVVPGQGSSDAALRSAACGQPNFHFGYFAADFTATTAVRIFDGLPDLTYFVAPQRGRPEWHVISPAESEVFVNQANGDVGLRRRGPREYLGSFARAWTIPLGFHPFQLFVRPAYSPPALRKRGRAAPLVDGHG